MARDLLVKQLGSLATQCRPPRLESNHSIFPLRFAMLAAGVARFSKRKKRNQPMGNAAPDRLLASGRIRISALILSLVMAVPGLAAVTPELQRAMRSVTFEVVLKKPTTDPLSYEKPLPLELLPFVERTDLYRSVGTAFALGKNTYVTAAHVMTLAIGSQYGAPALRASDGTVHPSGSVLKFSAHEDFVVFSLADNLEVPALPTTRTRRVDDPVLAVGNALGDGIVIRDGLFTSETPEEQDLRAADRHRSGRAGIQGSFRPAAPRDAAVPTRLQNVQHQPNPYCLTWTPARVRWVW
jgi:S1-C subfamily serine protease